MSLRERKKLRTRETISNAAIELFLKHGFDQVSITQVADAAEVSRRTLFAYFPTKEDLVIERFADHETESGRVVRARADGVTPVAALREHFLAGLAARDPITGLNDVPEIFGIYDLVLRTPSLTARMLQFNGNGQRELAEALTETAGLTPLVARLAAAPVVSVLWTLALANHERIASGTSADDCYEHAVEAAAQGFSLLEDGLGSVGLR
ncbi:TetR family transcriptional regulator [Amycolatopsis acidicola]|uniref:TetR family transcriptional regulator n=1 Tax=Amycolatopsis acidicola TaxID=2596893 RepID=A0A5N0V628_9PSEU|nr:TetR family transcriptional regulator [Amycolatopsis acidicola]KAA9161817.1 TetR family transcriptional regulator [Amycolatopsis acidicola]